MVIKKSVQKKSLHNKNTQNKNKQDQTNQQKSPDNYKALYEAAYEHMNTSVLDYDCGTLCSHNCCRNDYENPEDFGVYLMPYEYEHLLKDTEMIKPKQLVYHSSKDHFIPKSVGGLNYFYCDAEKDCLRHYRPIQCRTYPLEPHLQDGKLYLAVEKDQIHSCPLVQKRELWRPEYVEGIYKGWALLMQIPELRKLVAFDSDIRECEENYLYKLSEAECVSSDGESDKE